MALMHGKAADIYWDHVTGTDTELQHGQSWGLDVTHDTAEMTSMQDTWKTYRGGYQDWTATVTCLLDTAGSDIPPDSASDPDGLGDANGVTGIRLELYCVYDAAAPVVYKCLYGNCVCTGISVSNDKDSIATVTYTFQGVGQMLWYTSAVARPA